MYDIAALDGVVAFDGPAVRTVRAAIMGPPRVDLSASVASTLTVDCDDDDADLAASLAGLTASTGSHTWRLRWVRRFASGVLRLTFEDDITTRLRRHAHTLSVPAGSTTANELVERLAAPAGVPLTLDPARVTVRAAFTLDGSAWDGAGVLAEQAGRWRFSTGARLVHATPAWLLTRPAISLSGDTGVVGWTIDAARGYDTATVDAIDWVPTMGDVVDLTAMGPAAGRWLVAGFRGTLGDDTGSVALTRPRAEDPWR